jgi:aspartate/methionine/tyrosine aminotransferase
MKPVPEQKAFELPQRLRGLQPTLIRQFFERARPDSINFGLGEPDLPTPDFMRREAARIAVEEQNGYTSHPGLPALRKLIGEQYPHLNLGLNDVVVTCGSQEAMTAAFLSIVDVGDEVLIPNPSFPAYDACVRIAQGTPISYRLPSEKDFAFDIEEFESKITPRTKAAVVISPSNPTGKILTPSDLQQIAEVLKDTGIFLISDEIYSDLFFAERPHSASEYYDKTIIISGLSKSLEHDWMAAGMGRKQRGRRDARHSGPTRISDSLHISYHTKSGPVRMDRRSRSSQTTCARGVQETRRIFGRTLRRGARAACNYA